MFSGLRQNKTRDIPPTHLYPFLKIKKEKPPSPLFLYTNIEEAQLRSRKKAPPARWNKRPKEPGQHVTMTYSWADLLMTKERVYHRLLARII